MENIFFDPKYYDLSENEKGIDGTDLAEMELYDEERRREEGLKCAEDFAYFCHKYVKILTCDRNDVRAVKPLVLYKSQKRVIEALENHRGVIVKKHRRSGIPTSVLAHMLWLAMFRLDLHMAYWCHSERWTIEGGYKTRDMIKNLPEWMKPKLSVQNARHIQFADTMSEMWFLSPLATRARALDFLVVDDAAFTRNIRGFWLAIYPTIATNGKCVVMSEPNRKGDWFHETYTKAKEKDGFFEPMSIDYTNHPDYDEPEFIENIRNNIGDKTFRGEWLCEFL